MKSPDQGYKDANLFYFWCHNLVSDYNTTLTKNTLIMEFKNGNASFVDGFTMKKKAILKKG